MANGAGVLGDGVGEEVETVVALDEAAAVVEVVAVSVAVVEQRAKSTLSLDEVLALRVFEAEAASSVRTADDV